MRTLAIIVILCTLLSVGCTNEKSDYNAGIAAYKRGHYTAALYDFDKRANQGDPVAQFCLAFMYRNGKSVRADEDEAMYWYTKSAKQGYAPAQNNLAVLHFQKAKNLQYRVIERLGRGEEVTDQIKKKDDSLRNAMQWLQKAERQNNQIAQYNIALTHYFDAIIHEEYAKHEDEWVRLSKEAEDLIKKNIIESERDKHLKTNRELLEYVRSASTNAKKAYAEAVNWFTQAAIKDYPQAQYELANRYYYAEGIDENLTETEKLEKAVDWYTEAKDYAPAQNALAKMYAEGKGVEKDTTKAVELYKEAEKQKHADAQFNLAEMYSRGEGIDEHLTETERWEEVVRLYIEAANQSHTAAQNNLAKVYTEGISIAEGKNIFKNPEKAARLYFRAAQQGNPVAQANIGRNFETGLYNLEAKRYEVPRDDEEAYYWHSLALRDPAKLDELVTTKNYADRVSKWREGIGNKLEEDKRNEIQERVDNWKQKESNYSVGTGFYINEHYILTNAHVVTEDDDMKYKYDEFRIPYQHVKLIDWDPDADLALLYDKRGNTDIATFRKDPVHMGEKIVSFGYPLSGWLSYKGNLTEGTVSGHTGMLDVAYPNNYFQHTAPIQNGNSGGPVFDLIGNVVGVTKYGIKNQYAQNVNFSIKFDVVKEFLRKNGFEENLGSSIEKEKIYKIHYASAENLSDALNSKGTGVYEKAKKFTVPVLCFKNKEPEPVLLHEIGIKELVKTAKDISNSDED